MMSHEKQAASYSGRSASAEKRRVSLVKNVIVKTACSRNVKVWIVITQA